MFDLLRQQMQPAVLPVPEARPDIVYIGGTQAAKLAVLIQPWLNRAKPCGASKNRFLASVNKLLWWLRSRRSIWTSLACTANCSILHFG